MVWVQGSTVVPSGLTVVSGKGFCVRERPLDSVTVSVHSARSTRTVRVSKTIHGVPVVL